MANVKEVLKVMGKVSVFNNDEGENIKYFDFFTVVPVGGKDFFIKLKPDSSTSKQILSMSLGLKKDSGAISSKELTLKGEISQFNNDSGKTIKFVSFFVEAPFNDDLLKIKIVPPDNTAKALLTHFMGLNLSLPEVSGEDLPF